MYLLDSNHQFDLDSLLQFYIQAKEAEAENVEYNILIVENNDENKEKAILSAIYFELIYEKPLFSKKGMESYHRAKDIFIN